jgi:hypothetical protein
VQRTERTKIKVKNSEDDGKKEQKLKRKREELKERK